MTKGRVETVGLGQNDKGQGGDWRTGKMTKGQGGDCRTEENKGWGK